MSDNNTDPANSMVVVETSWEENDDHKEDIWMLINQSHLFLHAGGKDNIGSQIRTTEQWYSYIISENVPNTICYLEWPIL
jgi:hypothetical protein